MCLLLVAVAVSEMVNKLLWSKSWADMGKKVYKTCIVRSEQLPRSKCEQNAQYGSFGKTRVPIDLSIFMGSLCMLAGPSEGQFIPCMYARLVTSYLVS